MTRSIKRISFVLFCVYITAVILLCVIRTNSIPELPQSFLGIPIDKVAHFIMFLPFVILSYSSFSPTEKGFWRKLSVLGIFLMLGFVFAFATEKLQATTAYRSYEILDLVADGTGLIGGSLITLIYLLKKR